MNVGFIGLGHMGRAMAVTIGRAGHDVRAWNRTRQLTYLAQIASRLAVQPDFQYVIHPNTDAIVPNGRAFQLRFEVAF